jgi:hypothetical protein
MSRNNVSLVVIVKCWYEAMWDSLLHMLSRAGVHQRCCKRQFPTLLLVASAVKGKLIQAWGVQEVRSYWYDNVNLFSCVVVVSEVGRGQHGVGLEVEVGADHGECIDVWSFQRRTKSPTRWIRYRGDNLTDVPNYFAGV